MQVPHIMGFAMSAYASCAFFPQLEKFQCVKNKINTKQWFVKSSVRNNKTFLPVSVSKSAESDSKTIAERREMLSRYAAILVESFCVSQAKYEGSVLSLTKRIKEVSGKDISSDDVYINPEKHHSKRQGKCFPADISAPTGKSYKNASKQMKEM